MDEQDVSWVPYQMGHSANQASFFLLQLLMVASMECAGFRRVLERGRRFIATSLSCELRRAESHARLAPTTPFAGLNQRGRPLAVPGTSFNRPSAHTG